MTALATPIPSNAGPRPAKIAAIAVGVVALIAALAGAAALGVNLLRDGQGYFTSPTETRTGYAIAMKSVDVSDAPQWVFGRAGLDRIRVQAYGHRPLFIGIARASDIDRYLNGVEHQDISGLRYYPFYISYDRIAGLAPAGPPARQSFWARSVSGAGRVTLSWKPRPGNWRAIVMNADGSRGVTATMQFGARTSLLKWLGGALIGLAALAAAIAAALNRPSRA